MKTILHVLEATIAHIFLVIFRIMSFKMASNIGGFLGRIVGPYISATKTARRNLKMAMPELNDSQINVIVNGMWDNLGRVITEYSHIPHLSLEEIDEIVTLEGKEHFEKLLTDKGCFICTAHFGNWEMIAKWLYTHGAPLHIVYRGANNPYVDKIICDIRKYYQSNASPKGPVGARRIIKALNQGDIVAMLVDQKQNDGISVPFFGISARTAPAIATLSRKYDANIYPVKILRVDGHKFRIIFSAPIKAEKTNNESKDIENLMIKINGIIESWVRKNPEHWFWVHNRWPKSKG